MSPVEQLVIKLGVWPFVCVWLAWLTYWGVSARSAKRNDDIESGASRLQHWLPAVLGIAVVLATEPPDGLLTPSLWPFGVASYVASFVLTSLGLLFTVWARVHLGTNWSATVARKIDQQLVRSGPYAWVRHPIYSGMLLAAFGVFVGRGDVGALLGCTLVCVGLLRRVRIEERWMRQTFGDAYARYCAEVPSLLPGRAAAHGLAKR